MKTKGEKQKMKIVNKKRFITAIAIMIFIFFATKISAKENVITEDYIVSAGETLWSIACENADGDVREYIYQLREINNLEDCTIYPNQTIKIIK
jgi:LysM repeat protein